MRSGYGDARQAQRNDLGHALGPLRRVQPGLAQRDQPRGGTGDGLGLRAHAARQVGRDHGAIGQRLGALVRGVGGGQAGGEGEGSEG